LSICGEWRLCPALQSSDETLILQAQRMAGSTGRSAARQKAGEWPVRAVIAAMRLTAAKSPKCRRLRPQRMPASTPAQGKLISSYGLVR